MMETLLIFLAIIAIQMIAAYSKQKKEAAKKKAPPPVRRTAPAAPTAPIPDPFREIREMMGLPSAEEREPEESKTEYEREGFVPRKRMDDEPDDHLSKVQSEIRKLKIHHAIDTNNLEQGILWTAILQEPRHRIKWKPK